MGVFQRLNKSVLYYLETLMHNLHTELRIVLKKYIFTGTLLTKLILVEFVIIIIKKH